MDPAEPDRDAAELPRPPGEPRDPVFTVDALHDEPRTAVDRLPPVERRYSDGSGARSAQRRVLVVDEPSGARAEQAQHGTVAPFEHLGLPPLTEQTHGQELATAAVPLG